MPSKSLPAITVLAITLVSLTGCAHEVRGQNFCGELETGIAETYQALNDGLQSTSQADAQDSIQTLQEIADEIRDVNGTEAQTLLAAKLSKAIGAFVDATTRGDNVTLDSSLREAVTTIGEIEATCKQS